MLPSSSLSDSGIVNDDFSAEHGWATTDSFRGFPRGNSFDSDWAAPDIRAVTPESLSQSKTAEKGPDMTVRVRWMWWEDNAKVVGFVNPVKLNTRRWSEWQSPEDVVVELEGFMGITEADKPMRVEIGVQGNPPNVLQAESASNVAEAIVFVYRAMALQSAYGKHGNGICNDSTDEASQKAVSSGPLSTLSGLAAKAVDDTALNASRGAASMRDVANKAAQSVRNMSFFAKLNRARTDGGSLISRALSQIAEEPERQDPPLFGQRNEASASSANVPGTSEVAPLPSPCGSEKDLPRSSPELALLPSPCGSLSGGNRIGIQGTSSACHFQHSLQESLTDSLALSATGFSSILSETARVSMDLDNAAPEANDKADNVAPALAATVTVPHSLELNETHPVAFPTSSQLLSSTIDEEELGVTRKLGGSAMAPEAVKTAIDPRPQTVLNLMAPDVVLKPDGISVKVEVARPQAAVQVREEGRPQVILRPPMPPQSSRPQLAFQQMPQPPAAAYIAPMMNAGRQASVQSSVSSPRALQQVGSPRVAQPAQKHLGYPQQQSPRAIVQPNQPAVNVVRYVTPPRQRSPARSISPSAWGVSFATPVKPVRQSSPARSLSPRPAVFAGQPSSHVPVAGYYVTAASSQTTASCAPPCLLTSPGAAGSGIPKMVSVPAPRPTNSPVAGYRAIQAPAPVRYSSPVRYSTSVVPTKHTPSAFGAPILVAGAHRRSM